MRRRAAAGFTLVEALVALILSTVVVLLVTSVFVVQNDFFADVVRRSQLQESVRSGLSFVEQDLRAVPAAGVVTAEADRIVFRAPLTVGGVCAVGGTSTYLLFPLEGEGIDGAEVAGYAVRDTSGAWTFTPATWAALYAASGSGPAQTCAFAGADTTGATADFYELRGLSAVPPLQAGDLVMLYAEREIRIDTSALDSTRLGLFRGPRGGTLTELATGLSSTAAFAYQVRGRTGFQSQVLGGDLARITAVRVTLAGIVPATTAGRDPYTFTLVGTVSLRNTR